MSDVIYDVYWEGPFDWAKRNSVVKQRHVLYAIFGTHYVYGPGSLLYIGRTARAGGKRLDEHHWWVRDEPEPVVLRLASVGLFSSWEERRNTPSYGAAAKDLVEAIELLLIYSHQPAYNSQGKQELNRFHDFRIFNSGRFGTMLPEVSYRYYSDPPK